MIQARAVEQLKEDAGREQLFLLEHNHVFTLGRSAKASHILASKAHLDSQGIEVHDIGRGASNPGLMIQAVSQGMNRCRHS